LAVIIKPFSDTELFIKQEVAEFFFLVKYNGRIQGMFLNFPQRQSPFISSAEGHVEEVRPALVAWAPVVASETLHRLLSHGPH